MYTPIRDYAIIGNLRSAALVSKHGSIDWACVPYLDSPSVFGALLDFKKGGYWRIFPVGSYTTRQKYMNDTNILITTFKTKTGTVDLIDFIPIVQSKNRRINPEHEPMFRLYRKIICRKGKVDMKLDFCPRFDYARGETQLSKVDHGVKAEHESVKHYAIMISSRNFRVNGQKANCTINMKAGDSHVFLFHNHRKRIPNYTHKLCDQKMQETILFWENWMKVCDLNACAAIPFYQKAVKRSLLVLKNLFFEPPGSIAAAATTSLPEQIGGVRNWDYRYTWLRDASFTLQAMFRLGHTREASTYVNWLVRNCYKEIDGDPGHIQIMYGLRGEHRLIEEELTHLEGYMGSMPVRIGNAAHGQKQWDIYGGIIDMVWQLHKLKGHGSCDLETWEVISTLANYVVSVWREPDDGIWEVRGGARQFTHSKVMCWVALDRAIRISKEFNHSGQIAIWKRERDKIKRAVMKRAWSEKRQAFTQSLGGESLDASILLMPVYGFIGGRDSRMISTIGVIEKELGAGDGLLYRYKSYDGLPGDEGAFLLASFWLVDALVLAGKKKKARELYKRLLSYANHVGLFAEEMNPKTREFLGNFPQAYTHIGLINSAFYLAGMK